MVSSTVTGALVAGIAAGFAVAVPLGAIGVLVVDHGLRHGLRVGIAAGAGVAAVDGIYAVCAALGGASAAGWLEGHERPLRLGSAALLTAVAALLLRRAVREHRAATTNRSADPGTEARAPRPTGAFARFVALTAVNPLTLVSFAGVAVALPGARDGGGPAGAAFALGAFGASLAWQSTLASVGAAAGGRLPQGARTATAGVGAAITLALALRLALAA
jgi:threonine/homoserine/homoserine lactone efflux protein